MYVPSRSQRIFRIEKTLKLGLERRVELNSVHTCTNGYMIAFCLTQTPRDNPDSWWSLNNIVGSVKIPTQLAESGYDIVWVSKYVYKVVSSVDEYVRVYIRVEIRVYYNKKNLVWIFGYGVLQFNLWMKMLSFK